MSDFEGLHGDWQHMSGDEVEAALRQGAKALEAAQRATLAGEDVARAVAGEGAVELEAAAPAIPAEDMGYGPQSN